LELLFATAALFAVTIAASFIFYRRIRQAQEEYEGSKEVVRNITMGFTRQLQRLKASTARAEESSLDAQYMASQALKMSEEAVGVTQRGLDEVKRLGDRVGAAESAVEAMRREVQRLESLPRQPAPAPEIEAPIPVQQEQILEQLTDTEIEVLRIIEDMGEGTVPEIRNRIGKTREHTARLLKKLYDGGFVDRRTTGMPYRYHIRKEMRDLVQQRKEARLPL
jgi:hypothetical protein